MLSWLWSYLKNYRWQLLGAVVALVFTAGVTLLLGQGVKIMIDAGFAESSAAAMQRALLFFMVIVVLIALGTYCRYFLVSWLGERVVADIRKDLYGHLITLHPGFFEDNLSGEIQNRFTADTTLLQSVIGSSVSMALRNVLLFVGGLVLMFVSNVKLTLIVLATVPLMLAPMFYFGRKVRRWSKLTQDKVAGVGAWAGESLQNIKVVQAFTREQQVAAQFAEAAESAFATARKQIGQRSLLIALVMILIMGAVGGMIYVGGIDVINGRLSGGDLAAFIFYAVMVASAVATIAEVYGELQRATGAVERLRELLATESAIVDPVDPASLPVAPVRAALTLQEVSYCYPSRPDHYALDQVSLTVEAGERVALVGPSGAGKSTLFDMLLRFRDPESGAMLLNDVPLAELSLNELRSQFALVPQQPVLFSASVWENLRYGRPDATEAEVKAAVKAAYADEFIDNLPDGYDSFLGEQGVKLSGGQRQRLAIARAILRDPKILLLDEATSALDAQSEYWVQQALNELMKNRTTLIIAHRLATVAHVDRIAVMEQGKIVAVGSHDELLSSSTLYRTLAELQFRAA